MRRNIRINYQQYWLSVTIDPEIDDLRHKQLEPTTISVLVGSSLGQFRLKRAVEDATFPGDGSATLADARSRQGFDFPDDCYGDRISNGFII